MSDKGQQPSFRVAIYARYSSDMQNEISIDDQVARCREEIARRGWRVAGTYTDNAQSGWSLDRDGFNQLRADAERGRFDAVYFWKFDRLARNHDHAVMIKMLLRHEYNLKLFCVEGFSEDDDDSPYTAMMEQMLAVARALVPDNRLLLIDEPSEGLAPVIIEQMMDAIRQLSSETTVLLVEQNFVVASQLAASYVIIEEGQSVQSGRMDDLRQDQETIHRYLGAA